MSFRRPDFFAMLIVLALCPSILRAVEIDFLVHANASALWTPAPSGTGERLPTVRSYATATLYEAESGKRIYKYILLDHGVKDLNDDHIIYTARLDSANGTISNTTGNIIGQELHCYGAVATGHSNDFNIHRTEGSNVACMPDPPEREEIPKENCPVLLDLEMNGFRLSGPDPAVRFDIDADGSPDEIAWTRAEGDDAFLCLDRNGNGIIDDGSELFGYATLLLSGERAQVGYRALADLDHPVLGGNVDGKIDSADRTFQRLCVWNDRNRDGVSEPSEIQSAAAAGVVSLDYSYRTTGHRDSFGNWFRYVSRAEMRSRSGRLRSWLTYDVIFADHEP